MQVKQKLIDIITDFGDGVTEFDTKDVCAIITDHTNQKYHLYEQWCLLKEALTTMKWMFDNMKVVDPNLQSDAFNIPANGINSIEQHLAGPQIGEVFINQNQDEYDPFSD